MKVHAIVEREPGTFAATVERAEAMGFDGVFTTETAHDPFVALALAAVATENVELGTAITVAFPRSPFQLAQVANDIQLLSGGRFILGLGSQVRAHVERRFSASFDRPAARMRELVLAMRAIWAAWAGDAPLDFRGEFYTHTLSSPMFEPGANEYGVPAVLVAAVGTRMTEVAGEVADGVIVHGFSTPRYLEQVTLPALHAGLERSGRTRADVDVCRPVFLVTGTTDEERDRADARIRDRLAFYGSTRAYLPVLECHGWGDLHHELVALQRSGRQAEMAGLIDDTVLGAFALVGSLEELPALAEARYGGLVDRLSFNVPFEADEERWSAVVEELRKIPSGRDG